MRLPGGTPQLATLAIDVHLDVLGELVDVILPPTLCVAIAHHPGDRQNLLHPAAHRQLTASAATTIRLVLVVVRRGHNSTVGHEQVRVATIVGEQIKVQATVGAVAEWRRVRRRLEVVEHPALVLGPGCGKITEAEISPMKDQRLGMVGEDTIAGDQTV